jgi:hypothetical protein
MKKFLITEEERKHIMGLYEQTVSGNTQSGETLNYILIQNNWEDLPQRLQTDVLPGFLASGFSQKNKTSNDKEGITKFIDDNKLENTGLCKLRDGKNVYMIVIKHGSGVPAGANCEVEYGTSKEYTEYYGNSKSMVKTLPEGSNSYLLFKYKGQSILGIKKSNGNTCFTWAVPTTGYTPFKDCK